MMEWGKRSAGIHPKQEEQVPRLADSAGIGVCPMPAEKRQAKATMDPWQWARHAVVHTTVARNRTPASNRNSSVLSASAERATTPKRLQRTAKIDVMNATGTDSRMRLGPRHVSECPQQNAAVNPRPNKGIPLRNKASIPVMAMFLCRTESSLKSQRQR